MRRYLRCPGAICCPVRHALRAVLQPHIRFCDELIADASHCPEDAAPQPTSWLRRMLRGRQAWQMPSG